jgi:hypothetical protein
VRRRDDQRTELDFVPDVRDGLTRAERVVIWQLSLLERERGGRHVLTAQLYGRVVEHVDMSVEELQRILVRLGARRS